MGFSTWKAWIWVCDPKSFASSKRVANHCLLIGGQALDEVLGQLMAFGRHFAPGLFQDVDDFGAIVLDRKLREGAFEEHETRGIFKRLRFGVGFQSLFAYQRLNPRDRWIVVADRAKNVGRLVGMEAGEGRSPLVIAGTGHGVGGPGNGPSPKVLAADRETKGLGSGGFELREPMGHALAIE